MHCWTRDKYCGWVSLTYIVSIKCKSVNIYSLDWHVLININEYIYTSTGKIYCHRPLVLMVTSMERGWIRKLHMLELFHNISSSRGVGNVSPCSAALGFEWSISHLQWCYWVLMCYIFPAWFNVGLFWKWMKQGL